MNIIGAFLFGCAKSEPTSSPSQIDESPFTGIPCAAPCWQGLAIGESNENDVISTLSTLTFINQNSIQIFRGGTMPSIDPTVYAQGVEINASCIYPEKQCLTLRVVGDVLTEIVLVLNYEISVDKAIGYLGDPDYIGYGMLGAERIICEVYLVWSEKQLILASEKFEGFKETENNCGVVRDTGKITSSLIISEARYMSAKGIDFMLSRGYNQTFEFSGTLSEK
jgi:hypothetical protein